MLVGHHLAGSVEERTSAYGDTRTLVVAEDCVFPLVKGQGGPALRDLTPEKASRILEDEDVERAIDPGRR
jgi:hypothetical protein